VVRKLFEVSVLVGDFESFSSFGTGRLRVSELRIDGSISMWLKG
jgi:hypothetical protein